MTMSKRYKKTMVARLTLSSKRKMRSLLFDKKAVSVVVSTLVLTAGVLAMGIAVLYWAYSWGNLATRAYSTSEANNAKAVQERLGFEHIEYSSSTNNLGVYVLNWGNTNNITIVHVYLWDNAHRPLGDYSNPSLLNITTTNVIPGLNIGDEACFRITPVSPLASNSFYYIRVITGRGRTFDSTFATP